MISSGSNAPAREAGEGDAELSRAIEDLREMAARDEEAARGVQLAAMAPGGITMQIPVEVSIVLGSAEMSVGELAGLQSGSTIALDRRVGEPIDVVVNGVKIARGEIILMESDPSRFGFRILDIVE